MKLQSTIFCIMLCMMLCAGCFSEKLSSGEKEEGIENIDPSQFSSDYHTAKKILSRQYKSFSSALGSHYFSSQAHISLEIQNSKLSMTDTGTVMVDGDSFMRLIQNNDQGRKRDFYYINGVLFVLNEQLQYVARGDPHHEYLDHAQTLYGAAFEFLQLFGQSLGFKNPKTRVISGRQVTEYQITLQNRQKQTEEEVFDSISSKSSTLTFSYLKERKEWRKSKVPVFARGVIAIDTQLAIPLAIDFTGKFIIPNAGDSDGTLYVQVTQGFYKFGKVSEIKPPPFISTLKKQKISSDPLYFFPSAKIPEDEKAEKFLPPKSQ